MRSPDWLDAELAKVAPIRGRRVPIDPKGVEVADRPAYPRILKAETLSRPTRLTQGSVARPMRVAAARLLAREAQRRCTVREITLAAKRAQKAINRALREAAA